MKRLALERPDAELIGSAVGEGPTALLLHAGGERRDVWAPVTNRLTGDGFRAVAYDLRGHGESGQANADSLRAYADDVAAMLAAEAGRPVVVGASLGGLAALLALGEASVREQTAGLVLVDVVPDPPPDRVRAYLNELRSGLDESPLVSDVLGRRSELRAAAAELHELPTLLVRGDRSVLTEEDAERFAELVPRAQVELVAGAGHLVAADAPIQLGGLLATHLDSAAVRRRRIDRLLETARLAEVEHPGGTLLDHLNRTADTLEAWEAPTWVVDAGRLHAAYGTEGFPEGIPGVSPSAITDAAGARTERLVDIYGHCRRAESYPTFLSATPAIVDRRAGERRPLSADELRAFAELTIANELDVLRHSPELAATHGASLMALFQTWRGLIGPPARRAVDGMGAAQ